MVGGVQAAHGIGEDGVIEDGELPAHEDIVYTVGQWRIQLEAVERAHGAVGRLPGAAEGILEQRLVAEREHAVQATPSFAFIRGTSTRTQSGSVPFDRFRQLVEETGRA